ncbi:hypothetical protein PV327_002210 [Microctonus hyperodae]|uniref:Kinesin motor domain-containing protein n=1 Tax=Microctonus hyperodae TaxID=165561 RepID=A0AA39FF35_MICHY|nr:hypothetical protein PV327_002210 [Microctonus hyperodae]
MDRTLDSIRPVNSDTSSVEMSYLYGRDPSILAYSQRPALSEDTKKNLYSVYEIEESSQNETCGSLTELSSQTVKVYLRLKPFLPNAKLTIQQETAYRILNSNTLVTKFPMIENPSISMIKSSSTEIECRRYTFTETFGPEATQLEFFDQAIKSQMSEFIKGHNCTIMTYGTTNSGKSYTLQGTTSSPGIIPRGLEFVFANINPKSLPSYKPVRNCDVIALSSSEKSQELEIKNKFLAFGLTDKNQYIATYKQMQKLLEAETSMRLSESLDTSKYYSVWVSFAEIYNETIYDLLSNDCQKRRPSLKLATDNNGRAFIKGLKTVCVNSGSEAFQILMAGQYNLKVAATALNSRSSRSHCIFTIKLLKYNEENNPASVEVNTFSFCDLAGSERLKKTLNVGDRLKEAQNINTSLLVLGRCLKSIYDGQSLKHRNDHVGPFRESKLTRLFQRALSGKEPITLIVNVNPSPNLYIETQNVLNFAAIAKKIILQPVKQKRRKSKTRFSQIVNHNTKSVTDWDDTAALNSIPETSSIDLEPCSSIQSEEYEELLEENEKLRKEISAMKVSALNREFEIRQQMADTYSEMLKKVEDHYKNQLKDAEEQQEDLMEYNINRVEGYWKEKLSQVTSRKRSRCEMDDDYDDDEIMNVAELESENAALTSKVTSLKATLKDIRRQRDSLETAKNTAQYELSIVKEEMKKMKDLMTSMQQDLTTNGESLQCFTELQNQLKEMKEKNNTLKKYLKEAETEYTDVKNELEKKDRKIEERDYQIQLQTEKIRDLEDDFQHANIVLLDRVKCIEILEEKLERQAEQLNNAEERIEQLESVDKNMNKDESDIKIYEKSHKEDDQNEIISELKDQLQFYENENSLLSEKLSFRSNEIKSLKHDLDDAKNHIADLDEKLQAFEACRIAENATTQSNIEIKQEQIEYSSSDCQTEPTVGSDQINQTSFVDNESENLVEKLTDTEKELEKLKDDYHVLQGKFDSEQENVKKLIEQLNERKEIQEQFTVEVEEFKKHVNELESTVENLQRSESLHISMIEELKNELHENTIKCQNEHIEKIANLENDLLVATQSEIMHKNLIEQHLTKIAELNRKLSDIECLQKKVVDLDHKVEELQSEKMDLNEKLQVNLEKIDENNREIEDATKKLHEKDEEILRLQKEVKTMLQSTVNGENTMEKEFKKVLKELDEKKQEVLYKNQTIDKLQQQIINSQVLQKIIEDHEKEILKMKHENKSLENALNLKDEDMEKFKQNRDEVLAKYEKSLENMQEELNRLKHEKTENKESLRSTTTTPRTVDKNKKFLAPPDDRVYYNLRENKPKEKCDASDDEVVADRRGRRNRKNLESPVSSNTDEIAIIELSGSESKRTTRNTVKAATTGKRTTRKKKLFTQGDDSMIDLTPATEPSSPATSRSLRTRRK